jgi:hypothetical protein
MGPRNSNRNLSRRLRTFIGSLSKTLAPDRNPEGSGEKIGKVEYFFEVSEEGSVQAGLARHGGTLSDFLEAV